MSLSDRINHPERRQTAITPIVERRTGEERREEFMAPWRRRQIQQAGGRFVAVAWKDVAA